MLGEAEGHRVVVVAHPGVLGVELLAVRDLFELASRLQAEDGGGAAYRVEIASVDGAPEVWTGAGVSAAFDLVLALVEEDLGPDRAAEVARFAVVFLRRPGGQSQFSVHLDVPQARRRPVRDVQHYVLAHPGADLSLAALADRVNLSPRHFSRLFRAELGVSPGSYVDRVRLEAARRAVETSDRPLTAVAAQTGFGTAENLRRAFVAALGVAPAEYRRRFGHRPVADHRHRTRDATAR